jgi:hypothetical protein
MRRIVLQDAAVLLTLEGYKSHKILENEIFKSPEFLDFQKKLLQECENAKTPENLELERVVPLISEQLSEIRGYSILLKSQMFRMDDKFEKNFSALAGELGGVLERQKFSLGRVLSTLGKEMQSPSQNNQQLTKNTYIQDNHLNIQDNNVSSKIGLENFEMDRKIESVRAAWLEYTKNIAPLLDKKNWQKSETETRFFNRRKPLFAAMHQLLDGK